MAVLTDFLSLQCHENIAHTLTHTHTHTHTHKHTHTPRHRVTQGCAAGLVWACRLMHTLLHFLSSGCRHSAEKAVCKCCEPSLLQCVYGVWCVCAWVCVCVCVCVCVWEREREYLWSIFGNKMSADARPLRRLWTFYSGTMSIVTMVTGGCSFIRKPNKLNSRLYACRWVLCVCASLYVSLC